MINVNLLKAKMVEKGYTQAELCKKLGMAESTFIRKLKNGTLTFNEVQKISEILDIRNPVEVFFAGEGK